MAISSLEKFIRKEFSSLDAANSEIKFIIGRVLQKQDYNTTCLNEGIKVLTENDQAIAQSLDRLTLNTDKKIHEAAVAHGKELVKVNSSLDIIKKQVYNVSTGI